MEWYKRFKQLNSIWHYKIGSNYHVRRTATNIHTNLYFNTDYVVNDPIIINEISSNIFIPEINRRRLKFDWVVTYPPYGIPIAYTLASGMRSKFAYVNSSKNARCYFDIKPDEKILIVLDDIYSSQSLKETIRVLKEKKACISDTVFCLGNFLGKDNSDGLTIFSIIKKNATFWEEQDCPMCKAGSKPVVARPNWNKLMK